MGCEELIEALRKEADEKIRGIWREAEAEAEKARAEMSAAPGQDAGGQSAAAEAAGLLLDAGAQARRIRLAASDILLKRLYLVAVSGLSTLREGCYEDIFAGLASELPSASWQRVTVNDADLSIAARFFPAAEIAGDGRITGGMEVETEEGGIRVLNTLEKRLERAWSGLLPELMEDIYREVRADGTASES